MVRVGITFSVARFVSVLSMRLYFKKPFILEPISPSILYWYDALVSPLFCVSSLHHVTDDFSIKL